MEDVAVLGGQEARAEVDDVSEDKEQDEANKDGHESFLTTDTQEIPEHWHHCPQGASLISISVNTSHNKTSENNSVMNMTGTRIASVTMC